MLFSFFMFFSGEYSVGCMVHVVVGNRTYCWTSDDVDMDKVFRLTTKNIIVMMLAGQFVPDDNFLTLET